MPIGRDCVTVYNATAKNPIATDSFEFGESWHGDGERLHCVDWWMRSKIAIAAHRRWLARGGPTGAEGAFDDWLAAERELMDVERTR